MSMLSFLGFVMFLFLLFLIVIYLLWVNRRQKLEKESYRMHQLMQEHYHNLSEILRGLEPIMKDDREFFMELKAYVESHKCDYPVLGDVDGAEAEEFYTFLAHLDQDTKKNIASISSPITQQLDHMKLSLMRSMEAFSYAHNAYKVLSSSFPVNLMAKMFENEKLPRERGRI